MRIVDLANYPGYKVDEYGNVYGKHGRVLKPSVNHNGYQIVNFMIDGKRIGISVHTLVASVFVPNPDDKIQVNHIDGNKTNNAFYNLEWVTPSENIQHAISILGFSPGANTKRKIVGISQTDNSGTKSFDSIEDAGAWIDNVFGVSSGKSEVWKVANGIRKSARGYVWQYAS